MKLLPHIKTSQPAISTAPNDTMSPTIENSATEAFRGSAGTGNEHLRPLHHLVSERAVPLAIRRRPSVSQAPFVDGASPAGSSGASQTRRMHRDSFHERRDHRSYSAEWISSPLLEGFASFHNALNSVQEIASNLGTSASSQDGMNCSLPYLGTCWSHDHSGESSVGSSRSTQSSLVSTDTSMASSADSSCLVLDDWDILKARSLSTDISSPVPIENFMPFLFPMDPDTVVAHHSDGHAQSTAHSSVFGASEHNASLHNMGMCGGGADGAAQGSLAHASAGSHHLNIKPEHQTRVSPGQWPLPHQPPSTGTVDVPRFGNLPPGSHGTVDGRVPPMFSGAALRAPLQHLPPPPYQLTRASPPTVTIPTAPSTTSLSAPASHMMMPNSMVAMPTAIVPTVSRPPSSSSMSLPLADIQLLTKLNECYWKNGRKNLQCFPICPEHNDFYSMKMSNRKHTSVGVCRGPVYTHVFLPACSPHTKPPRTTGQHMKYEFGVGASGTGGSAYEVFVLGKFERVPQRDENSALQELLPAPGDFQSSSEFEGFRYSCFQAVEMEERRVTTRASPDVPGLPDHIVRSTWFFLPDVWKVQPMLKKKRKATRSAPAQAFPFCFRVFVYARERSISGGDGESSSSGGGSGAASTGTYRCLATSASSFFELYSTRTVDRVKRKYWGRADDEEAHVTGDAMAASMATTPSSTHVAKRMSRA